MYGRLVETPMPEEDIRETFAMRDLRLYNDYDEAKRAAEARRKRREARDNASRICPECGEPYARTSSDWGYVLQSTYYERAKGRVCTKGTGVPRRYFCSYHCYRAAQRIAEAEAEAERAAGCREHGQRTIRCGFCGQTFVAYQAAARYCCDECRYAASYERQKAARRARREGGGP